MIMVLTSSSLLSDVSEFDWLLRFLDFFESVFLRFFTLPVLSSLDADDSVVPLSSVKLLSSSSSFMCFFGIL